MIIKGGPTLRVDTQKIRSRTSGPRISSFCLTYSLSPRRRRVPFPSQFPVVPKTRR